MKKQTGITLIALIITIIVLLILAGVTINLTLGEKGIFRTAQRAVQNYKDAQDQELIYLNYFEAEMNNTISGLGSSSVGGSSTSTPKPLTYQAYNIGDIVTLNNAGTLESFYVMKNSPASESTVTLLSKKWIDGTTLKQISGVAGTDFSSEIYWSKPDGEFIDLNNYAIPAGVTSVVTAAKNYGAKFGATGRLMTKDEAQAWMTDDENTAVVEPDLLFAKGENSYEGNLGFWLGTAGWLNLTVWRVDCLDCSVHDWDSYNRMEWRPSEIRG